MLSPEMADPRESSHPTTSRPSSTWTVLDLESEARQVHNTNSTPITTQRPGLFKRVATFCFNLRTLGRRQQREAHDLPLQQPKLDPWPPLHIEKRSGQCCEHCVKHRKRRRRNQLLWLLIVILLLYLLGNTVALDVLTYTGGDSTSSVSAALSANQQLCLSEFEINAPVNASLYPCSTCLSTLQGVSSDFLKEHTQDAAQIQNAIQFCALRGVFVEAGGQGQSSLGNGGWMQNNQVCGWSGIGCNSEGQVTSLELNTPGIPTIVPSELGALTTLQNLQVVGDNQYPAGSLPSSFTNLSSLTTLEFQATGLATLSDSLFDSLRNVSTLKLIRNANMSSTLPSTVAKLPIQNLVINNQLLTNPLDALFNSSSVRSSLTLLDLASTNMTGSIPSSISSLTALVELHLDNNELTNPFPSAFPGTLQVLDLADNAGLSGTVDGSFCTLGGLQTCDVSGTGLKASGSCGVCQFS